MTQRPSQLSALLFLLNVAPLGISGTLGELPCYFGIGHSVPDSGQFEHFPSQYLANPQKGSRPPTVDS
jgi:hypothetical protein